MESKKLEKWNLQSFIKITKNSPKDLFFEIRIMFHDKECFLQKLFKIFEKIVKFVYILFVVE